MKTPQKLIFFPSANERSSSVNWPYFAILLPGDGYLDVTTVTLPDLKWRWVWDPLRSDLRFEKIVTSLAPASADGLGDVFPSRLADVAWVA